MPLPPTGLPTMSLLKTASIAIFVGLRPLRVRLRADESFLLAGKRDEDERRVELDPAAANTRASSIVSAVPLPSSLAPGAKLSAAAQSN